jgi:hypothetical protein
MTKNTKIIIGLLAVAGVGYYLYNSIKGNQKTIENPEYKLPLDAVPISVNK